MDFDGYIVVASILWLNEPLADLALLNKGNRAIEGYVPIITNDILLSTHVMSLGTAFMSRLDIIIE